MEGNVEHLVHGHSGFFDCLRKFELGPDSLRKNINGLFNLQASKGRRTSKESDTMKSTSIGNSFLQRI